MRGEIEGKRVMGHFWFVQEVHQRGGFEIGDTGKGEGLELRHGERRYRIQL